MGRLMGLSTIGRDPDNRGWRRSAQSRSSDPDRARRGNQVRALSRHVERIAPGPLVAVLVGWPLVTAFAPAFAAASNFGGPKDSTAHCDGNLSSQCVAENYTHRVWYDASLTTAYANAMNYAISDYSSVTAMSIITEGLSNTNDVRVYRANYGANNAWAWGACQDPPSYAGSRPADGHSHGHNWCKPQLLHWNLYYESNYSTQAQKEAIACHELGHTVGLRHSSESTSCMKNPPTTGGVARTTTTHDRGQVNAHYP